MSDLYLTSQTASSARGFLSGTGRDRRSAIEAVLKRRFDIRGPAPLLLLILPVMLAIAIIVGRDGGPILFRHARVGLGGRSFPCLKFRSMVTDAEQRLARLLA